MGKFPKHQQGGDIKKGGNGGREPAEKSPLVHSCEFTLRCTENGFTRILRKMWHSLIRFHARKFGI